MFVMDSGRTVRMDRTQVSGRKGATARPDGIGSRAKSVREEYSRLRDTNRTTALADGTATLKEIAGGGKPTRSDERVCRCPLAFRVQSSGKLVVRRFAASYRSRAA